MKRSRREYLRVKHAADCVAAVVALVLCLPLLAGIALAIRLIDGAPVLFRQPRAGRGGKVFTLFKFRTMRLASANATHAERVTKTGRILRRFGLDELPQLLNIVRGQMSFVGPRPTLPEQVARYGRHELKRLGVRPGLTGWAQIKGRNAIDWHRRITLDRWYVDNVSWTVDLKILLGTVPALLRNDQLYGPAGVNYDFSDPEDRERALAA